jgi:hypothetical protein
VDAVNSGVNLRLVLFPANNVQSGAPRYSR